MFNLICFGIYQLDEPEVKSFKNRIFVHKSDKNIFKISFEKFNNLTKQFETIAYLKSFKDDEEECYLYIRDCLLKSLTLKKHPEYIDNPKYFGTIMLDIDGIVTDDEDCNCEEILFDKTKDFD